MDQMLEDPGLETTPPGPERALQGFLDFVSPIATETRSRYEEFEQCAAKNEGVEDMRLLGMLSMPQSGVEDAGVLAGTAKGTVTAINSPLAAPGALAQAFGPQLGFLQLVIGNEIGKQFADIDSGEEDKGMQCRRHLDQGSVVMQVCALAKEDERKKDQALFLEGLSMDRIREIDTYMSDHGLEKVRQTL